MTPVGIPEIAERLGVQRQTVDQWRYRELLPEPRWTVGGRPAWEWADVLEWAQETGRACATCHGTGRLCGHLNSPHRDLSACTAQKKCRDCS